MIVSEFDFKNFDTRIRYVRSKFKLILQRDLAHVHNLKLKCIKIYYRDVRTFPGIPVIALYS